MAFNTKYVNGELAFYIETAETEYDRRARIISGKVHLMGGISLSELDYGTVVAKRAISEYNRTIGQTEGTYTEEMYIYGTPFRTAFAYITENQYNFFTRLKYEVRKHGENAIEFHRMTKNYSADSVVALLNKVHKAVHNVKYVTLEFHEGYIYPQEFNSKDELRKSYKLSKEELEVGLSERYFTHQDKRIQIKIIPSSVEPSFEKHKESTEAFIESLTRSLTTATDLNEQKELEQQIKLGQKDLLVYDQLLKQDERHNQKVAKLKGVNPDQFWNNIEINLKEQYQNQKKTVLKLIKDELVDLFIDGSRIDYEHFYKITKDMTRIETILKDLKQYDYEFEEYCILVKTRGTNVTLID